VLQFATPLEIFDRDFPGHVLRLIKRVRTSVVALVPPTDGIKATLSTTGTSRVVIRTAGFPKVTVQRGPESVAITSPVRATGLFDPDAQPDMLVPFEGIGVEAAWELRMPKAANRVDYSTIADVLLTIDYTALDSPDYRTELAATLDRAISAERVFSFRHMLQDQWFDLNNPDQTASPMKVSFAVTSADYPPNLEDNISIAAVSLYYVAAPGASTMGWDTALRTKLAYLEDGAAAILSGSADPAGGLAGTRLARGSDWVKFVGKLAVGEWTLAVPDMPATRGLFENNQIDDILFIVTYTATTPPWPDD
jgi:receptor-binding and translocation channel-forming TcA subunit of Tc toxin